MSVPPQPKKHLGFTPVNNDIFGAGYRLDPPSDDEEYQSVNESNEQSPTKAAPSRAASFRAAASSAKATKASSSGPDFYEGSFHNDSFGASSFDEAPHDHANYNGSTVGDDEAVVATTAADIADEMVKKEIFAYGMQLAKTEDEELNHLHELQTKYELELQRMFLEKCREEIGDLKKAQKARKAELRRLLEERGHQHSLD